MLPGKPIPHNRKPSAPVSRGWIAVDLDGTLAHYDPEHGVEIVGRPIEPIVYRIQRWLAMGIEVRIFTARASRADLIPPLQDWLGEIGLGQLAITNRRDTDLLQIWDDRVVQLEMNTGTVLTPREYIMLDISGWIGVELDGTLAHYHPKQPRHKLGEPVAKMRMRVQQWLKVDIDVRLFTGRAADPAMIPVIESWLEQHDMEKMKITCEKDFAMSQFWDDRGVHVVTNRGQVAAQIDTMNPDRKYPV